MSSVCLGFNNELILGRSLDRGSESCRLNSTDFYLGVASSHIFIPLLDVTSIVFSASKFL